MDESREQMARWLAAQFATYMVLPSARLPGCNEGLYAHRVCCSWHAGQKLIYDHLAVIGAQLLPPSEVPSPTGWTPDVFSIAWLKEFQERYQPKTDLALPSAQPRLGERLEEMPRWLIAAHKAWRLLDHGQQQWCNHWRFLSWKCCGWHSGLFLMREYLKFDAEKLLKPRDLPIEHGVRPEAFSQAWVEAFTKRYNLPDYQL